MKESEMLDQGFDHFVVPVNDIVVGERYRTLLPPTRNLSAGCVIATECQK
jgi:hypothetical protein